MNRVDLPNKQDFKIDEINLLRYTFMEVQNQAYSEPPIEERASNYSALGVSLNKGKVSNQIWLLAEDVKKLLPCGVFSNYVHKDEVSGETYPIASGIMFVSLTQLSREKTAAGELASFLLGKTTEATNEDVKRITKALTRSCEEFCKDKGVKNSMSLKEKWQNEARYEGIQQGIQQGIRQGIQQATAKLAELINSGLSVEDALKEVSENAN